MTVKLHKFEGRETLTTKVKITNAGDGLSEALTIEPQELTVDSKVYVVLECEVDAVTFKRVKDTRQNVRLQVLRAGTATLADKDLVHDILEAQRVKIEQAKGVERLDFNEDADAGEAEEGSEIDGE